MGEGAPPHTFDLDIRVPYAHVDQMGFVYYGHYLTYFEMARSALLRESGLPYGELEKRGVLLPVVEAHCNYRRPAKFDDSITVRTSYTGFHGPRLRIEYNVLRGDEELMDGYTVHVCMSPKGRVLRPLPELSCLTSAG